MRYRKLDANGDMVFGLGAAAFHRDSPEAVAQAVATRLRLLQGEWFLDTAAGTAWQTRVLGRHTEGTHDAEIASRILGTPGVTGLAGFESSLDRDTRRLTITATIDTAYGQATLRETL